MKAFLMYKDRDFNPNQQLPWNELDLVQDLALNTLLKAMANGDEFISGVCKTAVLTGSVRKEEILYRQEILQDCLKNSSIIRELFQITIDAGERKHKHWLSIWSNYPRGILRDAVNMMDTFVVFLRKLKRITDEKAALFTSDGFKAFFTMINDELNDDYFAVVDKVLNELKFKKGLLISAELGKGTGGTSYTLRKPNEQTGLRIKELFSQRTPSFRFTIDPRDDNGMRFLSDLEDQGVNPAADALAQSADNIDSFFTMLRIELAFYVGCLNLYDSLQQLGSEVTFPELAAVEERRFDFESLYDISLVLTKREKINGNDMNADGKELVLITGANQGGKSTFLRGVGIAQLMMQCGMFVPARRFSANLSSGVYTHYKRKEDSSMESGKFDEELSRMNRIAEKIHENALVLFNESFAATNELEGSEIASQITSALLARHVKVLFVTHQYEFARRFYQSRKDDAIFLRAQRQRDGRRSFKLEVGEPLQTSFGQDIYYDVFGKNS